MLFYFKGFKRHFAPIHEWMNSWFRFSDVTNRLLQSKKIFHSIRLQQPALNRQGDQPFTVEEALYVLGKNILGKNVTDRLFPVAKTLAKGMGHIGDGLSTFGELLPAPVELGDSALTLLPSSLVVDEDEYNRQVHSYIT